MLRPKIICILRFFINLLTFLSSTVHQLQFGKMEKDYLATVSIIFLLNLQFTFFCREVFYHFQTLLFSSLFSPLQMLKGFQGNTQP